MNYLLFLYRNRCMRELKHAHIIRKKEGNANLVEKDSHYKKPKTPHEMCGVMAIGNSNERAIIEQKLGNPQLYQCYK